MNSPQTYEVYHYDDNDPKHWFTINNNHITVKKADYTKVADVEALGLEEAFEFTNHSDRNWQESSYVTPTYPGRPERSTTIGDVIVVEGQAWMVAAFVAFIEVTFE
jgi:hypothetical protein